MGLLDKLKPQPRWKHADPAVRLEAVRELDDAAELALLAESDPDARVRRAAICRITDPAVLGRVAATDADPETRDRASDKLLALATAGPDEATALGAVRALSDPRRLATIAKSEAPDAIRVAALTKTTDERALGGIARLAKNEATALAALERLTDRDELVDVAQNSEHRDVALAAFERVIAPGVDVALVRSIEARSQQKPVSRRARAVLQEIEAAEQSRRAAEEERRRRELSACEAVERLAEPADADAARAALTRAVEEWSALNVADAALLGRFTKAVTAAEAAIDQRQREAAAAAEHARQRAEAIATRDALCARVETLDGDDVLAQLAPIEEEWQSLTPLIGDGPEADRLAERFARAVAACRKRHELGTLLADARAKLDALVVEAEGLTSQDDAAAASARWPSLSREARSHAAMLAEASRPADDLTARLKAVEDTLAAREAARDAARREAVAQTQQNLVGQLTRLAERARRAVEADTITLREGDRLMRDISAGLDIVPKIESSRDIDDAATKLRTLQEQVAPRVRELREMDDWRRFANAQRQEQLIAMAEAIVASLKSDMETGKTSDLAATARALRELHAKWHEVAEAPRHSAQRLWDRFRTATDFIRSRCESYFAQLRSERDANLQQKTAIVEEAEALANSSDWGKATARFQELQTAWQQTGPVPRDTQRDLGQRFRTACNAFFARRREDLASRKKTWTDNMARKEALCERAEKLAESTDWDAASSEMKRLQAEWKNIGPVRRSKSEAIWARFRAAADRFFERYHNRHQIAMAGKLAEREALVVELEQLAGADAPPEDLASRVQTLRTTWNRSVPIPGSEVKPLTERWQTALTGIVERHGEAFRGTDLDPAGIRQRMEKLIARVEAFLADVKEPAQTLSATELLAARLRSALASNAMGGRSNEDAKWRAASDAVKDAQTAWQRLGPLAGPEARALDARFREACRRVMEHSRRHAQPSQNRRSGSPRPSTPERVGV
jgi:uncharacterized protein DUF349